MIPSNFEALLLLLLFFLPGYLLQAVKAKFEFQNWDKPHVLVLKFLFDSLIIQTTSLLIINFFFDENIVMNLLTSHNSLSKSIIIDNFRQIVLQFSFSLFIAVLLAVVTSTKQFKRLIVSLLNKTKIRKIFWLNFQSIPALMGVFNQKANFGKNMVAGVVELNNKEYYEGNIKHVGFGENEQEYFIVLSKVVKISQNIKRKFPEDIEVLIPYGNIKSISYKTYPIKKSVNRNFNASSINIMLVLFLTLLLIILWYQGSSLNEEFEKLVAELSGALIATFLGVYASATLSKKQEQKKEQRDEEKVYLSSLKLIISELNLNETSIKTIIEALQKMPKSPTKLYDNFGFLILISKSIKLKAFYGIISSGAIREVSKKDEAFNKIQQAYFNIELAVKSLSVSRDMFKDFRTRKIDNITPKELTVLYKVVAQEVGKMKRTLGFLQIAQEYLLKTLSKKGVTFKIP